MRTPAYWLFFCFATAFGLLILSLFFDMLGFLGIGLGRFGIVSTIIAMIFLIIGAIFSIWTARFLLKLWNWRAGGLSLDDTKQSILDFGS